MQRLLMGEVGSGKTVVALYTLLRAVEHGYQGALMAPTETLAEQHFATVQSLMPGAVVPLGLLTGSTPGRRRADLLGKLETGELPLIVGTHALIEDSVRFARLAVAVIDEQHRFGVRQRAALDAKGPRGSNQRPHVLHMTATPIPRTLALSQYGDLDQTVLRELPAGRRPIETYVCSSESERARAYDRIREELRAGRQAFVVCPLVSESEALQARAATVEFERLRTGELRDFEVVLMHGQLASGAKQEAMAAFASGSADVLVATSVIEVGIDVPNATVMLVEDADRYGISQLHQLRGRIGRGSHDSLCLLFGAKESPRLRALAAHADGFRLAEIDLELRGEGELVGTRQHGEAQYRVAELPRDAELLERARRYAEEVIADDPELAGPEQRPARRRAARRVRRRGAGPDPGVRRAGRRGTLWRPRARRATGARHPSHLRPRARGAVLDPRLGSVEGARVLDLFAGSGALGIEALSRGALDAVLVDSSAAAVAAIRRNLSAIGADAEVRRQDALAYLRGASRDARQYDLVFLDPPYRHASALGRELSTALGPVLAAAARVVAESDRRAPLELDLPLLDERRYGDTLIRIHGTR